MKRTNERMMNWYDDSAFNLIEQSIFTQFILPLTSSSSSASQEKKTSYSWNHGDQFTKACTGLPSTVVTNCLNLPNDRKNSSCATVSKTKACGTVGTCTVKIEVKGKEDLSWVMVEREREREEGFEFFGSVLKSESTDRGYTFWVSDVCEKFFTSSNCSHRFKFRISILCMVLLSITCE